MRKTGLISFLIILALYGLRPDVYGQGRPGGQRRNVRDNIFVLRTLRMTQALDLTETQTAVIFPELNRTEKEKARLQVELAGEIRDLRQIINKDKVTDKEYEERVAKIMNLREKVRLGEEEFEKFLFGQLTSVQKAKYIIFNLDFNRGMIERMGRAGLAGQKSK